MSKGSKKSIVSFRLLKVVVFLQLLFACASRDLSQIPPMPGAKEWFTQWNRLENKDEGLSIDSQIQLETWRRLCNELSSTDWESIGFKDKLMVLLGRLGQYHGRHACSTNSLFIESLLKFGFIQKHFNGSLYEEWRGKGEFGYAFKSNPNLPMVFLVWEGDWLLDLDASLDIILRPIELKAKRHPQGELEGLLLGIEFMGLHPRPRHLLQRR